MREIVVIQLLLVDREIWFTIVHVRKREDLTVAYRRWRNDDMGLP